MVSKRDPVAAADRSSRSDWKAAQRRRKQAQRPEADPGPVLGAYDLCWCGKPLWHFKESTHPLDTTTHPPARTESGTT